MNDLKDISIYLSKIEKSIRNDLINAQRKTAESIRDTAKNLAPRDTGVYAESIKVKDTEVKNNKISTSIVTDATVTSKINGKEYNLGELLETGTDPHLIRPVDAEVLHFQINGEDIFTKLVHHPGFIAMPHFIPALNEHEGDYWDNIEEVLDKEFK